MSHIGASLFLAETRICVASKILRGCVRLRVEGEMKLGKRLVLEGIGWD